MSSVPPAFREEIQQRWRDDRIDDSVARYYLEKFTSADSIAFPDHSGRSLGLEEILKEDGPAPFNPITSWQGWTPIQYIGDRTYGLITLWERHLADGTVMRAAVKDAGCSTFFRDYCAEASLTKRLNLAGCKNVVQVLAWAFNPADDFKLQNEPKHVIAYEFADHGDLSQLYAWYKKEGLIFPEPFIWHVLCSIANALCFCRHGHAQTPGKPGWDSIVHGDIKCDNILLTATNQDRQPEGYPPIKLTDFGHAYTLGASEINVQYFVTSQAFGMSRYIAPEIKDRTPEREGRRRRPHELFGVRSDIWALGMVCKFIVHLVDFGQPSTGSNETGPSTELGRSMDLTRVYSPELRSLLDRCTALDPRDRPHVVDLFNEASATMQRMLEMGFESSKDAEGRLRPYHSLLLFTEHGQQRWQNDPAFRRMYLFANCFPLHRLMKKEEARRNGA